MHFHLPKPLHGWRAFVGEVGIIVVGVLIALGAEQIVQDVHGRAEQRAFRETIDHEIGLDLFVYDLRSRQFACDAKHVADLRTWLAEARAGEQVPALHPSGPSILTPYRSAWENRNAQVFDKLPAKQRQKYAEFYDELSNNWSIIEGEQAQWRRLIPYAESGPISLTDRRAIRPIISQIDGANTTLQADLPASLKIAEVLGVKAIRPDNLPDAFLKRSAECRSVIASPSETLKMKPQS